MAGRAKGGAKPAAAIVPVIAAINAPVLLNADKKPTAGDPHSRLPLIGDPPGSTGLRIMWGVLRRRYRDYENTATEFAAVKLRPSWSPDPLAITAARAEVVAPADADDSVADPWLLPRRLDHEIARDAENMTPLLGYATITDPAAASLHGFWEEVRSVSRSLVREHGGPVLAVMHAPGRAGNANALHAHLLISPYRVTKLGFAGRISAFCGDRGRQVVVDAWANRARFG
jgi:hypothetical protein